MESTSTKIESIGSIKVEHAVVIADPAHIETGLSSLDDLHEVTLPKGIYPCGIIKYDNEQTEGWGTRVAALLVGDTGDDLERREVGDLRVDTATMGVFADPDFASWDVAYDPGVGLTYSYGEAQAMFSFKGDDATAAQAATVGDRVAISHTGVGDGIYALYEFLRDGVRVGLAVDFLGVWPETFPND